MIVCHRIKDGGRELRRLKRKGKEKNPRFWNEMLFVLFEVSDKGSERSTLGK